MSITQRKLKNGKIVFDNAFMYKGIRYKKRGFTTKGKAENWEIEIKHDVNTNGSYREPCKKTFIQVYREWFELNKDKYAPNTIQQYTTFIKKIEANKIARMKITDIKYKDIQGFMNDQGKIYSFQTCKCILKIFNVVYKHAIKNEYVTDNPMPYVECKGIKKETEERKYISFSDFEAICEAIDEIDTFDAKALKIAVIIGYYTGARATEVLALSKNDIDFKNNTISFNKRLEHRVNGKRSFISTMKTKASYADIPLVEPLKKELLAWFKVNPYENICVDKNGSYIEYDWLRVKIRKIALKLNIPFTFHVLRHTLATNLAVNGVQPATAKKILRHSNISTTLDIYTHIDIKEERKALNSLFIPNDVKTNYPKSTPKVN